MFSKLIIWYWILFGCSHLRKITSQNLPTVLYIGMRSAGFYPDHISLSTIVFHFHVMLRHPCWRDFMSVASQTFLDDVISNQISFSSGSYNLSGSLLHFSLLVTWISCLVDESLGVGSLMISCFLHFDQW